MDERASARAVCVYLLSLEDKHGGRRESRKMTNKGCDKDVSVPLLNPDLLRW